MANDEIIGSVRFDFEAVTEKLHQALQEVLDGFDKLIAKTKELSNASEQHSVIVKKVVVGLGAAGLAGAATLAVKQFGGLAAVFGVATTALAGLASGMIAYGGVLGTVTQGVVYLTSALGLLANVDLKRLASGLLGLANPLDDILTIVIGGGLIKIGHLIDEAADKLANYTRLWTSSAVQQETAILGLDVAVSQYNRELGDKQGSQAFIDQSRKLALATGVNQATLIEGQKTLLSFAGTTKLNALQIAQLTQASAEYSAVTRKDFFSVIEGINARFLYTARLLASQGIATQQALFSQTKYFQNLHKGIADLTDYDKAAIVTELVLRSTKTAQDNLTSAQGTYALTLNRITTAQDDWNSELGKGSLVIDSMIAHVKLFILQIRNVLPDSLQIGIGFFTRLIEVLLRTVAALTTVAGKLAVLAGLSYIALQIYKIVTAFVSLQRIISVVTTVVGAVVGFFGGPLYAVLALIAALVGTFLVGAFIKWATGTKDATAAVEQFSASVAGVIDDKLLEKLQVDLVKTSDSLETMAAAAGKDKAFGQQYAASLELRRQLLIRYGEAARSAFTTFDAAKTLEIQGKALDEFAGKLEATRTAYKRSAIEATSGAATAKIWTVQQNNAKIAAHLLAAEVAVMGNNEEEAAKALRQAGVAEDDIKELTKDLTAVHKLYNAALRETQFEAATAFKALRAEIQGTRDAYASAVDQARKARLEFQASQLEKQGDPESLAKAATLRNINLGIEKDEQAVRTEITKKIAEANKEIEAINVALHDTNNLQQAGLYKRLQELGAIKSGFEAQLRENKALAEKKTIAETTTIDLDKQRKIADEAITKQEQQTSVAEAGVEAALKQVQAKRSVTNVTQDQINLDGQIRDLEVQKTAINAQLLAFKVKQYQAIVNIQGGEAKATQQDKDKLAASKAALAAAQAQLGAQQKSNVILASEPKLLREQAQQATALAQAQAQYDQDSLEVQNKVLQTGLEEEHSVTKRQQIQGIILDNEIKIHEIKKQELVLEIASKDALAAKDPLNAEQYQTDKKILELKLRSLNAEDATFEATRRHLQELGLEVAEVGRDFEDSIAKFGSNLVFNKGKGAFKDLWDSFKQLGQNAFETTIKNKLGFEGIVSHNLFQDAGGLVPQFTKAFGAIGDNGTSTFTGMSSLVASSTDASVKAAANGVQQSSRLAVQAGDVIGNAAVTAQSPWEQFFNTILSLGQNVFGILSSLAQGVFGFIFGGLAQLLGLGGKSGSQGSFLSSIFGGGGGGNTSQKSGGFGILDSLNNVFGFISGIGSKLFGKEGFFPQVGNFVSNLGGGGGSTILSGLNALGTLTQFIGGFGALVNSKSGIGKLFGGLSVLNSGGSLLGAGSAAFGSGLAPLTQGGFAVLQGGHVTGILGSSGLVSIEAPEAGLLAPGEVATTELAQTGNVGSTLQGLGGLRGIASFIGNLIKPVTSFLVDTFSSIIQPIVHAVTAVGTSLGIVGAGAGTAAAAGAAGAAGSGASSLSSVLGTLGPVVGVAGGAAGIALGIKQAIQANNAKGKAAGALTATAGALGIAGVFFPPLLIVAVILIIISLILNALNKPDIQGILKKNFAKSISDALGRPVSDQPKQTALSPALQNVPGTGGALDILSGAAAFAFGNLSKEHIHIFREFRKILVGALGEDSPEQFGSDVRKIVKSFFNNLVNVFRDYNQFLKLAKDAGAIGKFGPRDVEQVRAGVRLIGNQFQVAGVQLGDIFSRFVTDNTKIQVKAALQEARVEILTAVQEGAAFRKKDITAFGDPFLLLVKKLINTTKALDVLGLALTVAAARVDHSGRILGKAVAIQSAIVGAGLGEAPDAAVLSLAEFASQQRTPGRRRRTRFATTVGIAQQEVAVAEGDFRRSLAGQSGLVGVEAAKRAQEQAQVNLETTLNSLTKLHGKKLKEALQNIPDEISKVADATKQWAQGLSDLRQQIIDTQKQQLQSNIDLTIAIATLQQAPADIKKLYAGSLFIANTLIANAATPFEKLQAVQDKITIVQNLYSALIDETQREAEIQKKPLQDRLDAIDKESSALQDQLQTVQALAQLNESVKNQLQQLAVSGLQTRTTPGTVIASLEKQIAKARGDFFSTTGDKQAAAGQKFSDLLNQLLQFGQSAFQGPSPEFQAIFKEVTKGLEDIQNATNGAADQATSIQDRLEALATESKDLQTQIRDIDDATKAAVEALQGAEATDLTKLKNDLNEAYSAAIGSLKSDLSTALGPDGNVNKFLSDSKYAQNFLLSTTNQILNDLLTEIRDSTIAKKHKKQDNTGNNLPTPTPVPSPTNPLPPGFGENTGATIVQQPGGAYQINVPNKGGATLIPNQWVKVSPDFWARLVGNQVYTWVGTDPPGPGGPSDSLTGVGHYGAEIPLVPGGGGGHAAEKGLVVRAGEGGKSEAILPLEDNRAMNMVAYSLARAVSSLNGSGSPYVPSRYANGGGNGSSQETYHFSPQVTVNVTGKGLDENAVASLTVNRLRSLIRLGTFREDFKRAKVR